MFWFFGREVCGILAPQPGIEPAPPTLEGEDLTTGPPGKSPYRSFKKKKIKHSSHGRRDEEETMENNLP